ncbi:MAG: ABC-ATPase domain-containing protein [Deltaproteobacteria bacterium]|nr:ABC-ATPase domain-containing protein [Deltaproteobacteria bacterium]
MNRLIAKLKQINGEGYPAYKSIKGRYDYKGFTLTIEHVQGDPFAAPSRISVRTGLDRIGILSSDITSPSRRCGYEDGIHRSFWSSLRKIGKNRGSGKSGKWGMLRPGQEILPRTACEITGKEVTIRFTAGLPAAGRRILAHECIEMFASELPVIVQKAFEKDNLPFWRSHANASEDQDFLRDLLYMNDWIAFVGEGSNLPRTSGVKDSPLSDGVRWVSPEALKSTVSLPHAGAISGTRIPMGIVLICGGGYHGKSTLLKALEMGVYNHIPGDGREFCVSRREAVSIRAEDGRSVIKVDISPFINHLPSGTDTVNFSTPNASGSTSQSANIMEALELGAGCLLIDEDTSATNFMIRDARMQKLIAKDKEPITPFIDNIQDLKDKLGVSTVLVVGGSGEFFDVADAVIVMDRYKAYMKTDEAKEISQEFPSNRNVENAGDFSLPPDRMPRLDSLKLERKLKVKVFGKSVLSIGRKDIDVSCVSQLVDPGQLSLIGDWLVCILKDEKLGNRSLREICSLLEQRGITSPLSRHIPIPYGDRVHVRRFEIAATINRLRVRAKID